MTRPFNYICTKQPDIVLVQCLSTATGTTTDAAGDLPVETDQRAGNIQSTTPTKKTGNTEIVAEATIEIEIGLVDKIEVAAEKEKRVR